jgi:aminoglycoside phosphotransferase (APT) family kinase protein
MAGSGDYLDAASPVREGQGIDAGKLAEYLGEKVVSVAQFGRGYSNLTYLVTTAKRELVVRRAPPGVKIKSAHDMAREYKILSRLPDVWPKAPRALSYCDDESVIGTQFYVMERVAGIILRQKTPPGLVLDEARMRAASESLIDTLAEIHTIDFAKAGLADLGKPEGYVARQVTGWGERYRKAQTDAVPQVEALEKWLNEHMPSESGAALIHNDFKYDNVVLDAETATKVVSVLDWEMATLGDPRMDLGTTLGYWVQDDDPPVFQVMAFGPTRLPGNLRRTELVRRYAEKTGKDPGDVLFYFAYALFKLAVVAQQLYKRYKDGLTKEERYAPMLEGVRAVTSSALGAIERGTIE